MTRQLSSTLFSFASILTVYASWDKTALFCVFYDAFNEKRDFEDISIPESHIV
jgi:hypothetical protein